MLEVQKRTVFDSAGRADLGMFDKALSVTSVLNFGPVRLLRGVQGRTGGFGLAHIESHESRIKQFEAMGFREPINFVKFTVSDYDLVALQADGRLLFQRERNQIYCQVICQWDDGMKIWSVTTAIPKRSSRHKKVIWSK